MASEPSFVEKASEKIKELGETPVPLKHVGLIVLITVLVVAPPRTWLVTSSQKLHRL